MKFTIITHAEHKIKGKNIFAYEPYVREMNLWLKYVDEVEIIAPISTEEVASIESEYLFNKNEESRHPEFISGAHHLKTDNEMLKQVQHDDNNCHTELALPTGKPVEGLHKTITITKIPSFNVTSLKNGVKAIFKIPKILWIIYKAIKKAEHIHVRCPGNIGLLACIVQIGFPSKPKTIKYAGNWDPNSKQPWSYKLQKWILSNTFLTKNAKVLVYGKWPNQSKNIVPFFTASYSEKEISELEEQFDTSQISSNEDTERYSAPALPADRLDMESHKNEQNKQIPSQAENDDKINFLFVGALTKGKQPLLSVQVIHQLKQKGYKAQLNMYGEGVQRSIVEKYIVANNLQNEIVLHGNKSKEVVKRAYKGAHFLLFISKSEGWPKVVAEAMFWECLPITSNVSCVPYMLDKGNRGAIVNPNVEEIVLIIEDYILHKEKYVEQVVNAKKWSRQFTLEKFEDEIRTLL